MRHGFSLVELSIVLVILGLISGGILTGQNLIRAAELRSVTRDVEKYQTAILTFRDKYFALPGDMTNATDFWGAQATCPRQLLNPATCNGDGDGVIGTVLQTDPERCESFHLWKQLSLAGLIEAVPQVNFTNVNCAASINDEYTPRSKISQAVFHIVNVPVIPDSSVLHGDIFYNGQYGNVLMLGESGYNHLPVDNVIKPEEAWNIDKKVDDGRPAFGKVRSTRQGGNASGTDCATDPVEANAEYALSDADNECSLIFKLGF